MKLQKQVSRKVGNKTYPKWVVVLSPDVIKDLDWDEGRELKADVKNGKLTIW